MNASAIASDGEVARWRASLNRPPFVDTDTVRAMRDGATALQDALNEGFTDFVVIGLVKGEIPDTYTLKVFSRPRPRPCLMHILQTADNYVTQNLPPADAIV